MTKIIIVLSVIMTALAPSARSIVFEVEIPELDGSSADTFRTVSYVYDGPTGDLNGLSTRLRCGLTSLGYLRCLGGISPPDTIVWGLGASSEIRRVGESGYWYRDALLLDTLGAHDETFSLKNYSGFTTVTDGDVLEVGLRFGWVGYVAMCDPITPPTEGAVIRASIIFDVTPGTPVDYSTWGRIKSLFTAP